MRVVILVLQVREYACVRGKCCNFPCCTVRVGVCVQPFVYTVESDRWESPRVGVQDKLSAFRLYSSLITQR